jgi:hypothetical protein
MVVLMPWSSRLLRACRLSMHHAMPIRTRCWRQSTRRQCRSYAWPTQRCRSWPGAGYGRIVGVSGQNAFLTGNVTGSVRNAVLIIAAKNLADRVAGSGVTVNTVPRRHESAVSHMGRPATRCLRSLVGPGHRNDLSPADVFPGSPGSGRRAPWLPAGGRAAVQPAVRDRVAVDVPDCRGPAGADSGVVTYRVTCSGKVLTGERGHRPAPLPRPGMYAASLARIGRGTGRMGAARSAMPRRGAKAIRHVRQVAAGH